MSTRFDGKSVLITGGTRGIGRACALQFATAGAKVAICGRDETAALTAADALGEESGGVVAGYRADISSVDDVNTMIAAVEEAQGPISILVNNAGITRDGLLMRMKDDAWNDVLATNLTGTFHCCRAVCRGMMKARYGRIINVSSIVGVRGQGGQTNYGAAKAGIIGFTKSLAQELAPRNITANIVAPGYIDTEMTADITGDARDKILASIPARRQGTPEDVASAVSYLAGEDAGYITGHVLSVDGGLGM